MALTDEPVTGDGTAITATDGTAPAGAAQPGLALQTDDGVAVIDGDTRATQGPAAGIDTARGAMFEDDPRNLSAPHAMGMRTVHVAPTPEPAPHIHHHTDDLSAFLARLI